MRDGERQPRADQHQRQHGPLIGYVRTEAQRDAVVRTAWRGHAVMAVVDQIEITG